MLELYSKVLLKDGRTGNIVDIDIENGVPLYFVELDDEYKSYLPVSDLIWCEESDVTPIK